MKTRKCINSHFICEIWNIRIQNNSDKDLDCNSVISFHFNPLLQHILQERKLLLLWEIRVRAKMEQILETLKLMMSEKSL